MYSCEMKGIFIRRDDGSLIITNKDGDFTDDEMARILYFIADLVKGAKE